MYITATEITNFAIHIIALICYIINPMTSKANNQ